MSGEERRGLLKRLLGKGGSSSDQPPPKLFTAQSAPARIAPESTVEGREPSAAASDDGLFAGADRWDEVEVPNGLTAFDDALFSPENIATYEETHAVTQPVAPAAPDAPRSAAVWVDTPEVPPPPPPATPPGAPAAGVVVSDIPPAPHAATAAPASGPDIAALTDELTRLAEADEDLEVVTETVTETVAAPIGREPLPRTFVPDTSDEDDEPQPWVGHTDQLDEPYADQTAAAPRPHPVAEDPEPYATHQAHDGSFVAVDRVDGEELVVRRLPATPTDEESEDAPEVFRLTGAEMRETDRAVSPVTPADPQPAPAPGDRDDVPVEIDEPEPATFGWADATDVEVDEPEPVRLSLAEPIGEVAVDDLAEAMPQPAVQDRAVEDVTVAPPEAQPPAVARVPAGLDELVDVRPRTPEPSPIADLEPEAPLFSRSPTARATPAAAAEPAGASPRAERPGPPTPAHAAAQAVRDDGPRTTVHPDRIESRPGPIKLTPSEAVTLAENGPGSLRRVKPSS